LELTTKECARENDINKFLSIPNCSKDFPRSSKNLVRLREVGEKAFAEKLLERFQEKLQGVQRSSLNRGALQPPA
jgi:hypothetical protein